MVEQKIIKADGTEGVFIAFFSILFIFFSYVLVKEFLEHSSILKLLGNFIWIIVCIIQIYFQSNKLLNSQSENTLNNIDKYQVSTRVKQLSGLTTAIILSILLLVLLMANVNFFNTPTQLVGQPEYEPFNDCSYIAIGIALIIDKFIDLFNIKKSLTKSILSLFKIMLFISGMIMNLIYTIHLTEVNL
ncbi:MAG: hypothetical protein ACRC80_25400 [Waterburya sp.]